MISYQQAQHLLREKARSFGRERVGLEEAYGRVLAERIPADRDYPPFNRSAMDGYAIRYADFEKGIRLFSIAETIYAGETGTRLIGAGECYKIMTGAPVPVQADTVIRREDVEESEQTIFIRSAIGRPYQNISRQGEDLRSGDMALDGACLCEPAIMGLLASLGRKDVIVERLPRVALLTTGNEVVAVDSPVNSAQIRNSNRWLLQSFLKKWGIGPSFYAHVPDNRPALQTTLEKALGSELIILSGGVSAGDADHVPSALEELGVQKLFHKLSIRPGKPAWCGLAPGGGMVFALPGNPFSCLVGFTLLIQPWLYACFGLPAPEPLGLPLLAARNKKTPLDEFFPGRVAGSPAGLSTLALNGSGDIRLGTGANVLALHPAAGGDLAEGAQVACFSLGLPS